jgi:hypothetical protein
LLTINALGRGGFYSASFSTTPVSLLPISRFPEVFFVYHIHLNYILTTKRTVPASNMASAGPGTATVPELKNLTIENITENVHRINSQCSDPRLKYVMERLVSHLHDFARETRLSFDEWMAGIQFLTQVGQTCTDVRQVRSLLL